jgi:hypothetical protein
MGTSKEKPLTKARYLGGPKLHHKVDQHFHDMMDGTIMTYSEGMSLRWCFLIYLFVTTRFIGSDYSYIPADNDG